MEAVKRLLPQLTPSLRKGNCGRLAVVGGSLEYTGAPYFASISALKVGSDISHVFTRKEAATVIKSYSPELIVHPELTSILEWLPRMDGVLIGPGLGREEEALQLAIRVLALAKEHDKPTVVDADGLWAITEKWPVQLPSTLILTPNAVEMDRLSVKVLNIHTLNMDQKELTKVAVDLSKKMQTHLLLKGPSDLFVSPDGKECVLDYEGSIRRPGGLGDILSGLTLTFLVWTYQKNLAIESAAEAASFISRRCSALAYEQVGRGMGASDVIVQLAPFIKKIDNHTSSL